MCLSLFSGRKVRVYFDADHDPARNIALEEELFRRVEDGQQPESIRFWVSSECLVRGRVRSARYGWYHEALARKTGIRVVERATGGGVVYQDEGNLNWSLFVRNSGVLLSPAKMFELASEHMVKALTRLGAEARFAPPNRIDVQGRKVSGLAARSTPRAILVHGTLLLRSDLERLNRLCIPPPGCPPVANLDEWIPGIKAADIVGAVLDVLRDTGFEVRPTPA